MGRKSASNSNSNCFTSTSHTRSKSTDEGSFSRRNTSFSVEDLQPCLERLSYDDDAAAIGQRVMVVVDSTQEAKGALLWTLSHSLLKNDKLILLHVIQLPYTTDPVAKKGSESSFPPQLKRQTSGISPLKRQMSFSSQQKHHINPKDCGVLNTFKEICLQHRPEVDVELMVAEGKDKGSTILQQAKKLSVSLLVLGQAKSTFLRRLWMRKNGSNSAAASVVEYCIQNSECKSVAVRRNCKAGGYLITTKRQKDFWLLA